jgi:hypothetical protein
LFAILHSQPEASFRPCVLIASSSLAWASASWRTRN